MAKKAKINAEGGQPKKDTMKWTESMDVVLLDALLEQQANGNRIDGTFTTTAYNNVLKICREELKYQFDKDHLKNRIKTLKINFNACYDLSKSKPSAKKWRVTEIQNYDKLLELFAKDRANGEGAISAKEKVKQWEKESCDQFVDLERLEKVTTDNFNPVSPQCNSQGVNSSKVLKRKASMVDAFEKQVEMIQVGMNNVADAIREGNVIAEKGSAVIEKT
ncbi:hypothetical protein QYF36_014695 [Acer negundo]|nr:hypothetical protein QYF36_014695 [Acer negundo]